MAPTVPYADEAFGDLYFGERFPIAAEWDAADSATKLRALQSGTRMIDLLPLVNEKADEAQLLEFPRTDETEIPVEVQECNCEIALSLLRGWDAERAAGSVGVASESIGDAAKSYSGGGRGELARTDNLFGLPSPTAANLIAPWVVNDDELDLVRV